MDVSKKGIRKMLEWGDTGEYSHMIIFSNNFDYEYFSKFVKYGENIHEVINGVKSYGSPGVYTVKEIYNYKLDLDSQINESRAYHIEPIISKNTDKNIQKKNKALEFATKIHFNQKRKNGDPYINHPINVVKILSQFDDIKNYEALQQAAYLHDTIEDTKGYDDQLKVREEIKNEFGDYVAKLVEELTNIKSLMNIMGKAEYLSLKLVQMSDDALIIKLCDRLDNVNDLKTANEEFQIKYINETIIIIEYLLDNRQLNNNHLKLIKDIILSVAKYQSNNHENNYKLVKMLHSIYQNE